jgi:hypothetical protein
MAEINADANDVIAVLSERVANEARENAILLARLNEASKQIDTLTAAAAEKEDETPVKEKPTRR